MAKSDKKGPEAKPPPAKPKSSPTKKSPSKKPKAAAPTHHTVSNSLEVILPPTLGNATGDCNVLVAIDPDDSAALDFEGTTGAIGRLQVDSKGLVLDLKGSQYQGTILPGPTAVIASLHWDANHTQQLRLETITDEFCPLVKTQDLMATLDGQVEGTLDEGYRLEEENVNISAKRQEQEQAKKQQAKGAGKGKAATTTNNKSNSNNPKPKPKRKASTGAAGSSKSNNNKSSAGGGGSNKKIRVSMGRKK